MIELAIEYMQLLIFGAPPQGNRGAQTNSEKWAFYEARYEKYPTCLYWVTSRGPQNPLLTVLLSQKISPKHM